MPFLGSTPPANYKTLTKQTITGDGSTSYTLDSKVANGNEIEVFVNNVRQEPGTDYSANNNTITFTTALTSSDSCWLVFQSKAESTTIAQTGNIADGAVTNAKYGGAINVNTSAADNSVNIDASGNVGIGTNSPSSTLHLANDSGTYLTIDSQTSASSNGNASISFYNDLGAKADIIMHRSGLTQDLVFRNNTSGEGILFRTNGNNDRMYINKSGDVQLLGGSGIYIGGTASANKLDDYEEGTFTATLTGATGGSYDLNENATMFYTKIGNIVNVTGEIRGNTTTSTMTGGYVKVSNLPFQPKNVSYNRPAGGLSANFNSGWTTYPTGMQYNDNSFVIEVTASTVSTASTTIRMMLTYTTT